MRRVWTLALNKNEGAKMKLRRQMLDRFKMLYSQFNIVNVTSNPSEQTVDVEFSNKVILRLNNLEADYLKPEKYKGVK